MAIPPISRVSSLLVKLWALTMTIDEFRGYSFSLVESDAAIWEYEISGQTLDLANILIRVSQRRCHDQRKLVLMELMILGKEIEETKRERVRITLVNL